MEEFEQEFLSGFGWLLLRGFATLRIDDRGHVTFVGVLHDVPDEKVQQFPGAAKLAFLATHDSLNEIRSREGGSGMDELYRTLESRVPAGALLFALRSLMEEENARSN